MVCEDESKALEQAQQEFQDRRDALADADRELSDKQWDMVTTTAVASFVAVAAAPTTTVGAAAVAAGAAEAVADAWSDVQDARRDVGGAEDALTRSTLAMWDAEVSLQDCQSPPERHPEDELSPGAENYSGAGIPDDQLPPGARPHGYGPGEMTDL